MAKCFDTYGWVLLAAFAFAAGCGDGDDDHDLDAAQDAGGDASSDAGPDAAADQIVTIAVAARFGEMAVACGTTYSNVGTSMADYELSDFRFFVSNIRLLDVNDDEVSLTFTTNDWQADGVALLDFEDKTEGCAEFGTQATNTSITGTVPLGAGPFTTLRFDLGVPFALNHDDPTTAAAPLDTSSMFWVWQSGYKFVRIDGSSTGGSYVVHLGSTGCTSETAMTAPEAPCESPNLPTIELAFDPSSDLLIADAALLFAGVDVAVNTAETMPGCMSTATDPDCTPIFQSLGLSNESPQTFFRVE